MINTNIQAKDIFSTGEILLNEQNMNTKIKTNKTRQKQSLAFKEECVDLVADLESGEAGPRLVLGRQQDVQEVHVTPALFQRLASHLVLVVIYNLKL